MTVAGQEEIPKTQRAAVSDDASGFDIREIPVTQPDELEPGRALVKVLYSGVCHVSIPSSGCGPAPKVRPRIPTTAALSRPLRRGLRRVSLPLVLK